MRILDTIINAIHFGCALLRAHIKTDLAGPMSAGELDATLTAAAKSVPDAQDWRGSIVDLMKVLRLDSSLGARKQLARELGYPGALDGSAEMNTWLHAAVMKEVANRVVIGPAAAER